MNMRLSPNLSRPAWLKKNLALNSCRSLKLALRKFKLNTVCHESGCPNISECFSKGVATFLILGQTCTRSCSFCGLSKIKPQDPDPDEPRRIAQAVSFLSLDYLVITSPARDDLIDGGAGYFSQTVREILNLSPGKRIEILIPDFLGRKDSFREVALSGAETIAHNLETVPGLYRQIRPGADYQRSLGVLAAIKQINSKVYTKSGLMLGLGEKKKQLKRVLKDLRFVDCDFLTLGQYLPPSLSHYPLKAYIHPEVFSELKTYALTLGFKAVASGPYVRSSYLAHLLVPTSTTS